MESSEITIEINHLNEKGFGVGLIDGKEYWILNALPNEKVNAKVFKRKKGIKYAIATEIITASENRIEPKEGHYLSCSPWQILDKKEERKEKKELIRKFYRELAEFDLPDFEVVGGKNDFNYRNKVEFGFYGDAQTEKVSLAFHKREGNKAKYCLDSCVLLPELVNETAQKVVDFINKKNITARQLKGLLLRYSFFEKKVIAALYVKDENLTFDKEEVENLINSEVKGFLINYSDRKSPAFIETKRLLTVGEEELIEKIHDLKFYYPYDGFFQVNPKLFEETLNDIIDHTDSFTQIIDLYSGVGVIGLTMASHYCKSKAENKVIGVEIFEKSLEYAMKNATENHLDKCFEFIQNKSENTELGVVETADTLIVDPPRTGLHTKLITKIRESKPKKIIYLSCNPKTQAQNFSELKDLYEIKFFKAYDFYPNTPHVEALAVLEIINEQV